MCYCFLTLEGSKTQNPVSNYKEHFLTNLFYFFWAYTNSHLALFLPHFFPQSTIGCLPRTAIDRVKYSDFVKKALTKGFMFKDSAQKGTSDDANQKRGRKKKVCCFLLTSMQACCAACSGDGVGDEELLTLRLFLLPVANGINGFFPITAI